MRVISVYVIISLRIANDLLKFYQSKIGMKFKYRFSAAFCKACTAVLTSASLILAIPGQEAFAALSSKPVVPTSHPAHPGPPVRLHLPGAGEGQQISVSPGVLNPGDFIYQGGAAGSAELKPLAPPVNGVSTTHEAQTGATANADLVPETAALGPQGLGHVNGATTGFVPGLTHAADPVIREIAALRAAIERTPIDEVLTLGDMRWLSRHLSHLPKSRPFLFNWLLKPEEGYAPIALHQRVTTLKLRARIASVVRRGERRIPELQEALRKEAATQREVNELTTAVFKKAGSDVVDQELPRRLTAKSTELKNRQQAVLEARLALQQQVLEGSLAQIQELKSDKGHEWRQQTLEQTRRARVETAQHFTAIYDGAETAAIQQALLLHNRNHTYQEEIVAKGGIDAQLDRLSADIRADVEGRLLRKGMTPSVKSTTYELLMKALQAVFAAGIVWSLSVSWLVAVPVAVVNYYTSWPVMQKIVTTILRSTTDPEGHRMLTMAELKATVDEHVRRTGVPYTLAILAPKYSGNVEQFADWENYVRKDIQNLRHTLAFLGPNFRVVFICASNTSNKNDVAAGDRIAAHELSRINALNAEFGPSHGGQISFLYLRRVTWFNKVGNILAAMNLIADGRTLWPGYSNELILGDDVAPKGPIYNMLGGPILEMFGGPGRVQIRNGSEALRPATNEEDLRQAIMDGEQLVFDPALPPPFTLVHDDKNHIESGTVEKMLRMLEHPNNQAVMIATPNIEITAPTEYGRPIQSVTLMAETMARAANNWSEGRAMNWIYDNAAPFYGKGMVRTADWVRVMGRNRTLSARYAKLSHDWIESVLIWTEAMMGSTLEIRHKSLSAHEVLVHVRRGRTTELYQVVQEGADAQLLQYEGGDFVPVRTFENVLPDQRPLREFIDADLSHFLGDNAVIGERDLLSWFARLKRDRRWMNGDLHMIKTFVQYIDAVFARARFHLYKSLRPRFQGNIALAASIVLLQMAAITGLAAAHSSAAIQVLMVLTLMGVIGVDKFLVPFFYLKNQLTQARAVGERLGLKKLLPLCYATLNEGLAITTYSTLSALNNIITGSVDPIRILRADRNGVTVPWTEVTNKGNSDNSALANAETQGISLEEHYRAFKLNVAIGLGIFLVSLPLIAFHLVPVSILLPTGLGVLLLSFVAGPAAMYMAAIPHKKIFQYYPLVAALVLGFGYWWGTMFDQVPVVLTSEVTVPFGAGAGPVPKIVNLNFASALYAFVAAFFTAEVLTLPSVQKRWKDWRNRNSVM